MRFALIFTLALLLCFECFFVLFVRLALCLIMHSTSLLFRATFLELLGYVDYLLDYLELLVLYYTLLLWNCFPNFLLH